jgi:phosphoenolpyruvate-protein kinase (PTS system EI component)
VTDFSLCDDLAPGCIVVAHDATPDVILVMERAAGLIFETGGPACHAAILAREHGVPCVVGVHGALGQIVTGARVFINGLDGRVLVFPPAPGV